VTWLALGLVAFGVITAASAAYAIYQSFAPDEEPKSRYPSGASDIHSTLNGTGDDVDLAVFPPKRNQK
jgi:hypothetical protein